ncbi:methylthioribulose-1-phosphate dehydratase [Bacillus coahuilensis p1.1.43]|uniref:Methylthioribulose-1-phosphate dehydratase n=1 Tax=Bacillus coahuilensis p1.1.43 TaxID=1150625 RepID=A0A147KAR6_9BACI|nr:methylthioribulose 1-phosphate dehydratase [Bacillus coahuilensis]KUP07854.1 methylthioribulose-1-phosphate dehydratase [Bacillus coahuilensis p1.1.43]
MSYSTEWRILADIKDELADRDWFYGTSGNLSIKVSDSPLTFLVSASGRDKRQRTDDDFLLVDREGIPLEDNGLKPSAETLLHQEIYKKTNAGCCLHVHTVENNVLSDIFHKEGFITFKHNELIKALGFWEEDAEVTIPIIHNFAHIPQLAAELSTHVLGDQGAVLIHNHGITVWASTAFEAKKQLEAWEFLFQLHVKRRLLV